MSEYIPVPDYESFLAAKRMIATPAGFDVSPDLLHAALFGFQRSIVAWAIRRGRAAIFADCGLGKTLMQLDWAHHVGQRTNRPVLILTPLAVAHQTVTEARRWGYDAILCRDESDVARVSSNGIAVTNYDRIHHFSPDRWGGIVLDESSILKAFDGETRKKLTAFASGIPFRLCCTATPAPNDFIELTNHAEFLDVMAGKEIVALFFTQDGNTTHKWRLKGHARRDFWQWLASWAVAARRPSDLGYDDDGFLLPPLRFHQHSVSVTDVTETLFPIEALTLMERQRARRESVPDRVATVATMVNGSSETWIVWCHLNTESAALAKAIPDAVEVRGSDSPERKEAALIGFVEGRHRVLVSKPSIAGHGMNFQHCANVAFVGLSDSYEQFYQATRRCWRFGQTKPVEVHLVIAETEGAVLRNIERKERQSSELMGEMVRHMRALDDGGQSSRDEMTYRTEKATGPDWTLMLGDSVETIREIADESVGLTVTSPPFPGMYAYTNSPRDMGNVDGVEEMIDHFRFLIPELLRITMPGRLCCIHLMQLTAMQNRDGWIGLKDYRGRVIDAFTESGWNYAGEVTIDKNPQVQAVRNKERGLLFKSLATDAAVLRMALADYLIYFRKPGQNTAPIRAGISKKYGNLNGWITESEWVEWAAPVWYRHTKGVPGGIRETDVLNVEQARETDDERHLCPLQLGVIERAVKLWSNPGDLVYDPFAGIGSVGYESLRHRRRFAGSELKESYWRTGQVNCSRALGLRAQTGLFDLIDDPALEQAS